MTANINTPHAYTLTYVLQHVSTERKEKYARGVLRGSAAHSRGPLAPHATILRLAMSTGSDISASFLFHFIESIFVIFIFHISKVRQLIYTLFRQKPELSIRANERLVHASWIDRLQVTRSTRRCFVKANLKNV